MDGINLITGLNPVRRSDCDIKATADSYIVHQAERDRIHYLNRIAALIFELCDGENSVRDIARILGDAFDMTAAPVAEVTDCLDKLAGEQLIEYRAG